MSDLVKFADELVAFRVQVEMGQPSKIVWSVLALLNLVFLVSAPDWSNCRWLPVSYQQSTCEPSGQVSRLRSTYMQTGRHSRKDQPFARELFCTDAAYAKFAVSSAGDAQWVWQWGQGWSFQVLWYDAMTKVWPEQPSTQTTSAEALFVAINGQQAILGLNCI